MPESLESVVKGQRFEYSAETHNKILEAVRRVMREIYAAPSAPGPGRAPGIPQTSPQVSVMGENDTGSALLAFQVVKLSTPVVNPSTLPYDFNAFPVVECLTPASSTDCIGITLEDIPSTSPASMGRICVGGMVSALVEINNTGDQWAAPIAGDLTKLNSGFVGPARIVWKSASPIGSGSNVYLCVVMLYDGDTCYTDPCGTSICSDFTTWPGYVGTVQQFITHTDLGCLYWQGTATCASGSGSGSGSGGGGITTACCPGVSIMPTLYVSESGGGGTITINYQASGPDTGFWQDSNTTDDVTIYLRCSGSTWLLAVDVDFPTFGGNTATLVSVSCNPFQLVFTYSGVTYTVTS